jgi:hypothetical protein
MGGTHARFAGAQLLGQGLKRRSTNLVSVTDAIVRGRCHLHTKWRSIGSRSMGKNQRWPDKCLCFSSNSKKKKNRW